MNTSQTPANASSAGPQQTKSDNTASGYGGGQPNDDLLALIRAIALMWKHKWQIALVTLLFTLGGIGYALLQTPEYVSTAIIAPKEASSNSAMSQMMGQFGELGGMMAAQMGMSSTTMNRIAAIASSHDIAEAVVSRHDLLPLLFHKKYDAGNKCWKVKDSAEIPTVKKGAEALRKGALTVSPDIKKNLITLKIGLYDSTLAAKVLNFYLTELDSKMRSDIISEARVKRSYLDAQMKSTADPWVMQKLQALAGVEMEKSMMVAGKSFDILETPMVPLKKSKPRRRVMVMVAFFLGFCVTGTLILSLDYFRRSKEKYAGAWREG
ncbi:MAG: hypothetical protein JW699_04515 [Chitinispirillaceae bacterium]|nr:hypothetical protein [Chitinispirillaceae bacterium]